MGLKPVPVTERVWRYVDATGDCWEWTGGRTSGYGHISGGDGTFRRAHRVVYEFLVGPVPRGMQLDHLCRNRACVNPDHLEPVTPGENTRRSPLSRARRTHCPQGHEYTPENTSVSKRNQRSCRECIRAWHRANKTALSAARRRQRAARRCEYDTLRAEG